MKTLSLCPKCHYGNLGNHECKSEETLAEEAIKADGARYKYCFDEKPCAHPSCLNTIQFGNEKWDKRYCYEHEEYIPIKGIKVKIVRCKKCKKKVKFVLNKQQYASFKAKITKVLCSECRNEENALRVARALKIKNHVHT